MMQRGFPSWAGALLVSLWSAAAPAARPETLLLRDPTVSDRRIAFVYAGDLWSVDRDGGAPRRLTSDPAGERLPHFSPDGERIAFSMEHGDNLEVYVMPAAGGPPSRLTWHPGDDRVTGWSEDGARITFASRREVGNGRSYQLWEVSPEGGAPVRVMAADYLLGAWHGGELAYIPFAPAYNGLYGGSAGWQGYRGGATPSIHILDPRRGALEVVPGERVNDIEPMWHGDDLYFLSDREEETFNVYAWDRQARLARRLTRERDWDIRAADAHGGVIVYEAGGRLKQLDLGSGEVRELHVSLHADLPLARVQFKEAAKSVERIEISSSGKRALITARGEVFTVPTVDGSVRNLTRTDGQREYGALWSPTGERIAWVVQEADGQSLATSDQSGVEHARRIPLGPDFYTLLAWSGDGRSIAYGDNHLNLWVLELDSGRATLVATQARRGPFGAAFSPDGRWLAYTLERPNYLSDLMLCDLHSGSHTRVSDGMADLSELRFSPDGAYLYFGASTNAGPRQLDLDLSSREKPRRVALYALVLSAAGVSPLTPRTGDEDGEENGDDGGSDEARGADGKPAGKKAPAAVTRVDLVGISRRIVALPVPERNYSDLFIAGDGDLLFIDAEQPGASVAADPERRSAGSSLQRFDFEKRELVTIGEGITRLVVSADGSHLIAQTADGGIKTAEIGEEIALQALDTSGMRMRVDPRAEWAQIFEDAARMQPAFFYAGNMHGLDWEATVAKYRPLLPHVGRREDLNDLIVEMIAELQAGHNRAAGGDTYRARGEAPAGLLGADLRVERGRWRIARIYDGVAWNPFLEAPLAQPGLDVREGDWIVAIDGREVQGGENIYRRLQGTRGVQTALTVSSDEGGASPRTIVVVPAGSERMLRLWDWVETRRARVDEATGGRVAYVYLPNTGGAGYAFFNRMFFAQVDREALIIDERCNGGGQAANYILDVLGRDHLSSWRDREGLPFDTPAGAIHGPKVMLIDQYAGSGGDFLPWSFRRLGLGPLIGTRTWGGLIGISANPAFVDGGRMTVPHFRFYTPEGEWQVENAGVAPDIEVAADPLALNRGEDPQLERAITEVLKRLAELGPGRHLPPPALPTDPGT
jgi:tricorn protease